MNSQLIDKDKLIQELQKANIYTEIIAKAIDQAESSHKTQIRDSGLPYLSEHVYPVAFDILKTYPELSNLENVLAAAILHDTVEDDLNFPESKLRENFPKEIADLVIWVTKKPEDNKKGIPKEDKIKINQEVIEKMKKAPFEAQVIKLSDRYNNLFSIIHTTETEKQKRYIYEVKEFYLPFSEKVSPKYYKKFNDLLNSLNSLEDRTLLLKNVLR